MKAREFRQVVLWMANHWHEGKAIELFGNNLGKHYWDKWCDCKSADAGTMRLFYEMDDDKLQVIIDEALK